jgi:hypothetical protein
MVGRKDIVTLALAEAVEDYFFVGVFYFEIYVKGAARLDLRRTSRESNHIFGDSY